MPYYHQAHAHRGTPNGWLVLRDMNDGEFFCVGSRLSLRWNGIILFFRCERVCTHCLPERACGVSRQDGHGLVFDVIYYARVRNLWARIPLSVFVCVSACVGHRPPAVREPPTLSARFEHAAAFMYIVIIIPFRCYRNISAYPQWAPYAHKRERNEH